MAEFWPLGLDLSDTSSPREILKSAEMEWMQQSGGLLTLVIQDAESKNGHRMLIVHAKYVPDNRTVTLFSVVHRPGAPYPAKIQPRDAELPDFLKKSYYRSGIADAVGVARIEGREVTNKWVSETPSEFRSQLKEVFNLGTVKAEVVSVVSGTAVSLRVEDEDQTRDDVSDAGANDAQ